MSFPYSKIKDKTWQSKKKKKKKKKNNQMEDVHLRTHDEEE